MSSNVTTGISEQAFGAMMRVTKGEARGFAKDLRTEMLESPYDYLYERFMEAAGGYSDDETVRPEAVAALVPDNHRRVLVAEAWGAATGDPSFWVRKARQEWARRRMVAVSHALADELEALPDGTPWKDTARVMSSRLAEMSQVIREASE